MKTLTCRVRSSVLIVTLLIRGALTTHGGQDQPGCSVLVKWKDGQDSRSAVEGNRRIGARVLRNLAIFGWQEIALPPGMGVSHALEAYHNLEGVSAVEPNRALSRTAAHPVEGHAIPRPQVALADGQAIPPNDPLFKSQWYLQKIGATNAWRTSTGSSDVIVAVVDCGVDYRHPELAANMWQNPGETGLDANGHDKATNGIDDDGDGYIDDVYGADVQRGTGDPMDLGFVAPPGFPAESPLYHGTFIAGLIGAAGNNGLGIAGVNWSIRIMAVRSWGGDYSNLQGNSDAPYYFETVRGLDYVLQMKRRGVNIRVVSHSSFQLIDGLALRDVMGALDAEGIMSFFPAFDPQVALNMDVYSGYPNCYNLHSVLNIAASTQNDSLASWSGYGRSTVDFAAPGVEMTSTWTRPGYQSGINGTSFACPLAAASAALLIAAHPELGIDEVKAALFGSVDSVPALKGKVMTNGRLNVGRAFSYLADPDPPAIVLNAFPAGQRTPPNFPIQVAFNRPMSRASVESALSIQPPVAGRYVWSADSRAFSYEHDIPFDSTTNYTVRIAGSATDASGGGLDGNYDRSRQGAPLDDFVWTFRFKVPNDDFVDAEVLRGDSGTASGDNRNTDWEIAEPQLSGRGVLIRDNTVWYRWTPTETRWQTFEITPGVGFDTVLDVFSGVEIASLVPVVDNDDYGAGVRSRVSWPAIVGKAYSIRVAGKNALDPVGTGAFHLVWYPTPAPGFVGSQMTPVGAPPGTAVTLTGTNFTGATAVLLGGISTTFTNAPGNNVDLRITAVVPPDARSGPITVVTPHGSATSTILFQAHPPPLSGAVLPGGDIEISWASTSPEFVLETSDSLRPLPTDWSLVGAPVIVEGGRTRVRTSSSGSAVRFFRLRGSPQLAELRPDGGCLECPAATARPSEP